MRLLGLLLLGGLLLGAYGADFTLGSTAFTDGGTMPVAYTGDGAGGSPSLEWSGAPTGTRGYALIMHHVAPDLTKWYWLLYNIPVETHSLPAGVTGVGLPGTNSVNGQLTYAPPHSKGPGPKTYILTLYALDAPLHLDIDAAHLTRDALLDAMRTHVLASATLKVTYSRGGTPGADNGAPPPLPPQPSPGEQSACSVLPCRPTAHGITLNVLATAACEGYIEYGADRARLDLRADTRYYYRLCTRRAGDAPYVGTDFRSFQTQRAPGSGFTFCLQDDSHPERPQQHNPALYAQTLEAVAADGPDFYLTIGDDFSVDALKSVTSGAVQRIYRQQRDCLCRVRAPVFLMNGNHEQAALCNLDGTPNNVAVWAQQARNSLFPQPAPDGFYTGDALFVVIDPYWHSTHPVDNVFGGGEKRRDVWEVTLGDVQYRWLVKTLEGSAAKYKFVFAHHVLGTMRGGTDIADLYEWGGHDRNGADLFAAQRPGWPLPIHQLMAKTGVTVFFQGHDHLFARQERDGVVYQTLPEPATPTYFLYNADAYRTGDMLPNSGYFRVTVTPASVTVAYVRQYLPKDKTATRKNGEVAFRYTLPARQP